MFAKLLKHEFRAQKKTFFALSIAALGVGLLGGLIMWFLMSNTGNSTTVAAEVIGTALSTFGLLGTFLALVAYALAMWIMLLLRFYRHHFTNEGYLTFTLPATTGQILWASITNIMIWMVITGLVLALSIGMIITPVLVEAMKLSEFDMIVEIFTISFSTAFAELEINPFFYLLSMFSSFVYSLTLPLLCITIGSIITKKYKLLASFGIYYGISLAISTLSGILSVVATLSQTLSDLSKAYSFSIIMPAIIQLCIGIGSYCLMHRLISKKLNLQ